MKSPSRNPSNRQNREADVREIEARTGVHVEQFARACKFTLRKFRGAARGFQLRLDTRQFGAIGTWIDREQYFPLRDLLAFMEMHAIDGARYAGTNIDGFRRLQTAAEFVEFLHFPLD